MVDRSERLRARRASEFPLPTGREEEWRFTPLPRLRDLLKDESEISVASGAVSLDVSAAAPIVVEQLTVDSLPTEAAPADRVAALAQSVARVATVISAPSGTQATDPVLIRARGRSVREADFGRLVVDVGELASAIIVLDHVGSATYADTVDLNVADQAQLTVVSIYDWAPDAVHLSSHRIQVGRDARVVHVVVTLGGDVVRVLPEVTYTGSGGDVELIGLSFTDPGQHHEHRIFVDHSTPHCRSNVNYKGALVGEGAHSVWIGDVLIRAAATGTDTYEINRNLLLSRGPRADSVPNLEIETGDVASAGHASVTGRLDDDQLFYLMSRGVSEKDARRLVVNGFFSELIDRIDVPYVTERLNGALEAELERATDS